MKLRSMKMGEKGYEFATSTSGRWTLSLSINIFTFEYGLYFEGPHTNICIDNVHLSELSNLSDFLTLVIKRPFGGLSEEDVAILTKGVSDLGHTGDVRFSVAEDSDRNSRCVFMAYSDETASEVMAVDVGSHDAEEILLALKNLIPMQVNLEKSAKDRAK